MKLDFLKKLNFLSKLNEEQRTKLFNRVMKIFVFVSIIISVACMVYLKTSKLRIKDNEVELGDKYYQNTLLSYDNVKVADGYSYRIKDNKVDINTIGEYEITFEIRGYGETVTETKKVKVVDTTPAEVTMSRTTFYIGDKVDLSKVLVITDLSGEIAYADAKVKTNKNFDTSKAGESTIKVTVTDKNGVEGTTELTITVEDPMVNLYTYITEKLSAHNSKSSTDYSFGEADGDFILITGSGSYYTLINYTKGTYHKQSGTYYSDTIKFDANFKANEFIDAGYSRTDTYTSGSQLESAQKTLDSALKNINEILGNTNGKINIYGKTLEEIKNATLDLRTLY